MLVVSCPACRLWCSVRCAAGPAAAPPALPLADLFSGSLAASCLAKSPSRPGSLQPPDRSATPPPCRGYKGDGNTCKPDPEALQALEALYWNQPQVGVGGCTRAGVFCVFCVCALVLKHLCGLPPPRCKANRTTTPLPYGAGPGLRCRHGCRLAFHRPWCVTACMYARAAEPRQPLSSSPSSLPRHLSDSPPPQGPAILIRLAFPRQRVHPRAGYLYDPLGSFAVGRPDGAGSFGSRANVSAGGLHLRGGAVGSATHKRALPALARRPDKGRESCRCMLPAPPTPHPTPPPHHPWQVTLEMCRVACQAAPDCEGFVINEVGRRLGGGHWLQRRANATIWAAATIWRENRVRNAQLQGRRSHLVLVCSAARPGLQVLQQCFLKREQCPSANFCWGQEVRHNTPALAARARRLLFAHACSCRPSRTGVQQSRNALLSNYTSAAPAPPPRPPLDWQVLCNSTNDRGGLFSFPCGHWMSYYRLDMDVGRACSNIT